VLKQHEAGRKVAELSREIGVSEATIYTWKSTYGGMEVNEAQRLKSLEEENRRLKQLIDPNRSSIKPTCNSVQWLRICTPYRSTKAIWGHVGQPNRLVEVPVLENGPQWSKVFSGYVRRFRRRSVQKGDKKTGRHPPTELLLDSESEPLPLESPSKLFACERTGDGSV
jgi:hypothetical protein